MPSVAALRMVFTATCTAKAAVVAWSMPSVEPGLKPYHPNQNARVPSTARGKLVRTMTIGWMKLVMQKA